MVSGSEGKNININMELMHFSIEGGPVNSQQPGRFCLVAARFFQCLYDFIPGFFFLLSA
jgi:hypothetical protein